MESNELGLKRKKKTKKVVAYLIIAIILVTLALVINLRTQQDSKMISSSKQSFSMLSQDALIRLVSGNLTANKWVADDGGGVPNNWNSVLKWDISSIPLGSRINESYLYLEQNANDVSASTTAHVYYINQQSWTEADNMYTLMLSYNLIDYDDDPYLNNSAWQGLLSDGNSVNCWGSPPCNWRWNVTNQLQQALDNGNKNFTVFLGKPWDGTVNSEDVGLVVGEGENSKFEFTSRTGTNKPVLNVTYTAGAGTTVYLDFNNDTADIYYNDITANEGLAIKWDIRVIPSSKKINDAKLCMYNVFQSAVGNIYSLWYASNQSWVEWGGNNQNITATWIRQNATNVTATKLTDALGEYTCINVTTQLRQAYANGNQNFTMLGEWNGQPVDFYDYEMDVTDDTGLEIEPASKYFIDREGYGVTDMDIRPSLMITYSDAGGGGDTTKPYFLNNTPYNMEVTNDTQAIQQVNATDETGMSCFSLNDTYSIFDINCSGYFYNDSGLITGLYYFNLTINDTSNNINWSEFYVNVSDAPDVTDENYPIFSDYLTDPANNSEFDIRSYYFNSTILSSNGTAGIEFNGTNYTLTNVSSVFGITFDSLDVGTYTYYYWAFGNGTDALYNLTTLFDYTVQTNSSYALGITKTDPIEYEQVTDFTGTGCPSQLVCSLNITNEVYGAGTVYANYSSDGNDNYTASSVTSSITINKNSSYSLSLTATTPITYGTATDFAGSGCPSQLTCSLNITNGVFSPGTVSANYSTAGNTNYSKEDATFTVTINQATPSLTYYLNGQNSANITTLSPYQINASAYTNGGTAKIFENGNDITSSNGAFLLYTTGWYEFIFNVTGNENYTSLGNRYLYANLSGGSATNQTSAFKVDLSDRDIVPYVKEGYGIIFK